MSGSTSTNGRVQTVNFASGVVALIGVWVMASPVLMTGRGPIILGNIITGLAIALLVAYNGFRVSGGGAPNSIVSVILVLLGVWVISLPFILLELAPAAMAITPTPLVWSNVVAGVLITILAAYALFTGRKLASTRTTGG